MDDNIYNLLKCDIVDCPQNNFTGFCKLSNPEYKEEHPVWYIEPDRCTHKKFKEREKK